jgi:dipeptidyl aminopeptidase/acylaminoacyl peptidase
MFRLLAHDAFDIDRINRGSHHKGSRLVTRSYRLTTVALIMGFGALTALANTGPARALALDAQTTQVKGKIASDQDFGHAFIINKNGSDKEYVGLYGSTVCMFWSPDGRKLTCNVFSDSGPIPATVRRDGAFTYINSGLPLDFFCMFWSPNAHRLLCHSEGIQDPADAGFYTARFSDAGGRVRITTTPDGFYDVAYGFSPDGSRILFGRSDFATNTGRLYVVNSDGSHQVRLSPPGWRVVDLGFFDQAGAHWSRNGSRVTFAAINRFKQGSPSRVFVVDADGGNVRAVTPRRLNAISAQWSPSRPLITLTSCSGGFTAGENPTEKCGTNQVWLVRSNGDRLRKVVSSKHGADFVVPVWSPNGKKLLFEKKTSGGKFSLWTVRRDGSRRRKLTRVKGFTHYAWGSR